MHDSNAGWRRTRAIPLAIAVLVSPVLASGQPAAGPTFTRDVAPILQRSCQGCHRTGQMAPMSLVTFEEVRPWARAIQRKVAAREMPPWHIDKTIGIQEFANDISLTTEQIEPS